MQRLLHIADRHRSASTTRWMGFVLAFNAGAVNAGGFLVVGMYTSHMSGFASQVADSMILGKGTMLLSALGALLSFVGGAAASSLIIAWSRRHHLRSALALPLLMEAALLLPFGMMGAITLNLHTPLAIPPVVLLLAFIMGLQNAVGTLASGGRVRSTHMTGNVTDLGIEFGKLLYRNRPGLAANQRVRADRERMRLFGGLLFSFVGGGIFGAAGFSYVGFFWVIPLAVLLLLLAMPPLLHDLRKRSHLHSVLLRVCNRLRLRH
jgi:uncharacterized membrane protein YoaK (UPF0700 family)